MWACPPTYRPKEATTASLLAPSEVSSSFLTCLTSARLHRSRSRAPPSGRVHCPFAFNRFLSSFTSSFSLALLWAFFYRRLVRTFFVFCRPPSPFLQFKPHSSHTRSHTVPLLPTPAAVFTDHPFPAFCPYILSLVSKEASRLVSNPLA